MRRPSFPFLDSAGKSDFLFSFKSFRNLLTASFSETVRLTFAQRIVFTGFTCAFVFLGVRMRLRRVGLHATNRFCRSSATRRPLPVRHCWPASPCVLTFASQSKPVSVRSGGRGRAVGLGRLSHLLLLGLLAIISLVLLRGLWRLGARLWCLGRGRRLPCRGRRATGEAAHEHGARRAQLRLFHITRPGGCSTLFGV